jgi:tetratricopeptide (TPR) repeat protein
VADVAGLEDVLSQVLVGLAGIARENGNLPAARAGFREALTVAERSGDADSVAFVHHALLGLEQQAGDLPAALNHGWAAMSKYESAAGRLRCLAGLAGALLEFGDHDAAEDAWVVVAASSAEKYYRVFAHDALSHIAALRREREVFEARVRECDALGWQSGDASAKAEILFYRGLSYRALREYELARSWLERARDFAEQHRYHRVYFKAEAALAALVPTTPPEATRTPSAPPEVREGLRAMRRELVGCGA